MTASFSSSSVPSCLAMGGSLDGEIAQVAFLPADGLPSDLSARTAARISDAFASARGVVRLFVDESDTGGHLIMRHRRLLGLSARGSGSMVSAYLHKSCDSLTEISPSPSRTGRTPNRAVITRTTVCQLQRLEMS
jgi:hypothetical protein